MREKMIFKDCKGVCFTLVIDPTILDTREKQTSK
jgi:hypothetical protein